MAKSKKKDNRKIWLVPHPTSQFKEDVKELAARNRLKVIDSKFAKQVNPERIATDTPTLTPRKKAADAPATNDNPVNVLGLYVEKLREMKPEAKPNVDELAVEVDGKKTRPTAAERDKAWEIYSADA